jgi:hypothetical protein
MSDINKNAKNEIGAGLFNAYSADLPLKFHPAAFGALACCMPGWAG